jgi:6-phosphogluconolactonase (cycloisomerase 2 family)
VVVDPSGKFVYVADENSEQVAIFGINSDGTLTPAGAAAAGAGPLSIGIYAPK